MHVRSARLLHAQPLPHLVLAGLVDAGACHADRVVKVLQASGAGVVLGFCWRQEGAGGAGKVGRQYAEMDGADGRRWVANQLLHKTCQAHPCRRGRFE